MRAAMSCVISEFAGAPLGYLPPTAGLKPVDAPGNLADITKVPAAGWGRGCRQKRMQETGAKARNRRPPVPARAPPPPLERYTGTPALPSRVGRDKKPSILALDC
eukprot:8679851-Heterocapsa_arctica.AAC.1